VHGVGGTEAHVLMALSLGIKAEEFVGSTTCRRRDCRRSSTDCAPWPLDAAGGFTDVGRATKAGIMPSPTI
jgi:hypothetical protein